MIELKIEYLPIEALEPYEKNTRKHENFDVDELAKSIKRFGFNNPIAIWSDHNVIVSGHGRLQAAKKLKYEKVPVVRLDHLTDKERRAYAVMDNKTAEFSGWDFDMLRLELPELDLSEFDFDFTLPDLPVLEEENEIIEDEAPEVEEGETKTKQGDIFKLGRHYLMCGDSTKPEHLKKLLNGAKVDLVLTDPPYGVSIVSGGGKVGGDNELHFGNVGGGGETRFGKVGGGLIVPSSTYMQIKGDDTTDTARGFYKTCTDAGIENFIIFGGNYFTDFVPPRPCWLVWDKQINGNFADFEMAWTSFNKAAKMYHWLWNGLCRKGDRKTEGKSRVHPTQKPVGLLADILKDFSKPGNIIYDGFGGSGSTLMACEQTDRSCYMIEYEPHYIDVIIKRWEAFTDKQAEKITDD